MDKSLNPHDEDDMLRSVALQNAQSILAARQRAEAELVAAKETLESKTNELAQSLAIMRATLESTTNAILVTNDVGFVTDFNAKYVDMWKLPRDLVDLREHRPLVEFISTHFSNPASYLARIEEIYTSALGESIDLLELIDGRIIERFSKIQTIDGRNTGRVWSFSDISEHRRAEDAAKKAALERELLLEGERSARAEVERISHLKDEFLATLSHELRTPLNSILGWAQILRVGGRSEVDLNKGLEIIERNSLAQAQLIEDLLDMNRIASGQMRLDIQSIFPVMAIEAAIETIRPAANAKDIRLERILDPIAGPISGDASRLQQIVWNMLSNAIKFTPKQGKVQVVLKRVNSHIEISVTDDGAGIAAEFLPYIFDRFRQGDGSSTRRHGGLGLGLSIVKALVELHGGTVSAESAGLDLGTSFHINFPLAAIRRDANAAQRNHPTAHKLTESDFKPLDLSGIKILVVDDEADARSLLMRVLSDCHAEVISTGLAAEALLMIEKERPHVMISDIGMPEVDGFELLKRVRALGRDRGGMLPAIALTAFARSEDRTRALRAGFLVHIAKPVNSSELIATVASSVGRIDP